MIGQKDAGVLDLLVVGEDRVGDAAVLRVPVLDCGGEGGERWRCCSLWHTGAVQDRAHRLLSTEGRKAESCLLGPAAVLRGL